MLDSDTMTLPVIIGEEKFFYPMDYGFDQCFSHDTGLAPICSSPSAPNWCNNEWCYVDAENCAEEFKPTESSYRPGEYYSYETCDYTNTFALRE